MNGACFLKTQVLRLILLAIFPLLASGCGHDDRSERKVQHISCVNNLKQIGLDFRIWAGDNDGKFPFQVSTNKGGTLELCNRDTNGFDRNSIAHFLVVSNELSTPVLLCCPHDHSKTPVVDWGKISVSNVTYRLRTDYKVSESNPHEILAVCPVDGNILYCDGSVSGKEGKPEPAYNSLVMELLKRKLEEDGSNSNLIFMVMSNNLNTPRVKYTK